MATDTIKNCICILDGQKSRVEFKNVYNPYFPSLGITPNLTYTIIHPGSEEHLPWSISYIPIINICKVTFIRSRMLILKLNSGKKMIIVLHKDDHPTSNDVTKMMNWFKDNLIICRVHYPVDWINKKLIDTCCCWRLPENWFPRKFNCGEFYNNNTEVASGVSLGEELSESSQYFTCPEETA